MSTVSTLPRLSRARRVGGLSYQHAKEPAVTIRSGSPLGGGYYIGNPHVGKIFFAPCGIAREWKAADTRGPPLHSLTAGEPLPLVASTGRGVAPSIGRPRPALIPGSGR